MTLINPPLNFVISHLPPSGVLPFDGTEVEVELGLIDYEFTAPAIIGQDIAQLSAWLYLYSTSWLGTRLSLVDAVRSWMLSLSHQRQA